MRRTVDEGPRSLAPVAWFFALAYALSWGWWWPIVATGGEVERGVGWPTQVPGLLGPMIAAFVVTAVCDGRPGVRALASAMVRWPRRWRWRLAALSPLAFLAVSLLVAAASGNLPSAADYGRMSGVPAGIGLMLAALVINGFGEETGWRGFAQPRLQERLGPLRATMVVAVLWAGWHSPLFLAMASYRDFSALILLGFLVGLGCGAVVLTAIYNGSGGSILAVALWHALYNLAVATEAGEGLIAPLVTFFVIFWAVSLVQRERAGVPSLDPRPGE
jgi:membrane protease YdiL (CAAX protease family)